MPTPQSLVNEVLKLGPVEKAELIELLLSSFDSDNRRRMDEAWSAEVEQRIDAYESGDIPACSAEDVFARIDKK